MNTKLIKRAMFDRGVKVIDLSRRLDVPYDRLVRILNGFRRPTPAEVEAIARLLDLDPNEAGAHPNAQTLDGPEAA